MDGRTLVKLIDEALEERGMTQGEFCSAIGISSAAMSAWRKGSMPKPERVAQIEAFLGVTLSEPTTTIDSDTADLLESIRSRQDLRVLLHSAKDVPPSSVYQLISQLEKWKENAD